MRTASVRFSGALVVGLLLGGGAARADFMNWSYQWSISPAPVLSSGTGTVALALYRGGKGASFLPVAAVTTSSSATTKSPDHFHSSFNLTLHLTDIPSHQSGNLTFHGTISGTLTATSSHLTETFAVPTEHITLGGHTYYVTLRPSHLRLLPPGSPVVPQIDAIVRVRNAPRHATAAAVMVRDAGLQPAPEPSALFLASLAAGLLGSFRARRSRRSATA